MYTSSPVHTTIDNILYSGYLTKRGHRFPTWKRRYFILTTDGELSYFASEGGRKKGSFQFNEWTVIEPSSFFDPSEFGLTLRGNMTSLYIKVDTEEEKDKWVYELEQMLKSIKEGEGDRAREGGIRDGMIIEGVSRSRSVGEVDTGMNSMDSQESSSSILEMSSIYTARAQSTS